MRSLFDSVSDGLAILGVMIVIVLGLVAYLVLHCVTPSDTREAIASMPTPSRTLTSPAADLARLPSLTPSPTASLSARLERSGTPEPPRPAATQTPVRIETPSMTHTVPPATLSPTSSASAMATSTTLPTGTPTIRPLVSRTPAPSATPTVLPAPVLWAPADGAEFDTEDRISLVWAPAGALAPDAFYEVTLTYRHAGQVWIDDIPWLKETIWVLSDHPYLVDLADDGAFVWSVQLMRMTGTDPVTGKPVGEAMSSPSDLRAIYWKAAGASATPAPPQPAGSCSAP